MCIRLSGKGTQVVLSDAPWQRGIQRIVTGNREIPFLLPALCGHHFFTGTWPPPPDAIDYEPHKSPGALTQLSSTRATWHQLETPYTHIETRIDYEIVDRGTIEARFETHSHATAYPFGYAGLFWGTIAPPGGQRGLHLLVHGKQGKLRWSYFQGGGKRLPARQHRPGSRNALCRACSRASSDILFCRSSAALYPACPGRAVA